MNLPIPPRAELPPNDVPAFIDAEERDRLYGKWVEGGGVMRDGQMCYVTGIGVMKYDGDKWVEWS